MRYLSRLAIAVAITLSSISTTHAQAVERPTWKAGDTWTLRQSVSTPAGASVSDVVWTVVALDADGYQLSSTGDSREGGDKTSKVLHISRDLNKTRGDEVEEMDWLQWPLVQGRGFDFAGKKDREWSATVEGWEEITTPAGTFKAMKVSHVRSGQGRRSASETVWYSPEMKQVIRRVSVRPWASQKSAYATTTTEVIAFRLN